jgi:hypothetical protein
VRDVKGMTDDEIVAELKFLGDQWDESRTSDDEGHGGSPGEGMVERMGALEQEQKHRTAVRKGFCLWPSGCVRKRLHGLSFCRTHQPYPATSGRTGR